MTCNIDLFDKNFWFWDSLCVCDSLKVKGWLKILLLLARFQQNSSQALKRVSFFVGNAKCTPLQRQLVCWNKKYRKMAVSFGSKSLNWQCIFFLFFCHFAASSFMLSFSIMPLPRSSEWAPLGTVEFGCRLFFVEEVWARILTSTLGMFWKCVNCDYRRVNDICSSQPPAGSSSAFSCHQQQVVGC